MESVRQELGSKPKIPPKPKIPGASSRHSLLPSRAPVPSKISSTISFPEADKDDLSHEVKPALPPKPLSSMKARPITMHEASNQESKTKDPITLDSRSLSDLELKISNVRGATSSKVDSVTAKKAQLPSSIRRVNNPGNVIAKHPLISPEDQANRVKRVSASQNDARELLSAQASKKKSFYSLVNELGRGSSLPGSNETRTISPSTANGALPGEQTTGKNILNLDFNASKVSEKIVSSSNETGGEIPPPPLPPRKSRPSSIASDSLSIGDSKPSTPSSPLPQKDFSFSIYAQIDKEAKWASRRAKANSTIFENSNVDASPSQDQVSPVSSSECTQSDIKLQDEHGVVENSPSQPKSPNVPEPDASNLEAQSSFLFSKFLSQDDTENNNVKQPEESNEAGQEKETYEKLFENEMEPSDPVDQTERISSAEIIETSSDSKEAQESPDKDVSSENSSLKSSIDFESSYSSSSSDESSKTANASYWSRSPSNKSESLYDKENDLSQGNLGDSESDTTTTLRTKKRINFFRSFGKGGIKGNNHKKIKGRPSLQNTLKIEIVPRDTRSNSISSLHYANALSESCIATPEYDTGTMQSCSSGNSIFPSSNPKMTDEFQMILDGISDTKQRKLFQAAHEIMSSEQVFVKELFLLTEDFPAFIRQYQYTISDADIDKMIGKLKSKKQFNIEMAKELENRIINWSNDPRLADIFIAKGAYLKLYIDYVTDHKKIIEHIEHCCKKNEVFAKSLQDFESLTICENLKVKHHMITPVQRVTKYRLLLEKYQKYLEEDSEEYNATTRALKIVQEVVNETDKAVDRKENAEKLMNIQNRLVPSKTLLKPGRVLLLEGDLKKVCRKDFQTRYFALLNDSLLCMSYISAAGTASKDLKLSYEFPLQSTKIFINERGSSPNEFTLKSKTRSFNLIAENKHSMEKWMSNIQKAIQAVKQKNKATPEALSENVPDIGVNFGKEAPVWIHDSRASMCMICASEFTYVHRRHHCRACGQVICGNCSDNQAPLAYKDYQADRVCDNCYELLLNEFDRRGLDVDHCSPHYHALNAIRSRFKKNTPNARKIKSTRRGVLEKKADSPGSKIASVLYWRKQKGWKKQWVMLFDNVLYIYDGADDPVASKALPILGWGVLKETKEHMENMDEGAVFRLEHSNQPSIIFQAEKFELAERWIEILKGATILPP